MLPIFDSLRDLTFLSVAIRMAISFLCGGLIGIEREYKRRSAGFRTHILICLGAAITTLTSQYLSLNLGYQTDISRLGAQVIAGVGFIGAGSILVTNRQRVRGLTTAAGLWAAAIIGLCFGAGFYEGGLIATVLILLAEVFLSRVEHFWMSRTPEVNMYLEYLSKSDLAKTLRMLQEEQIQVLNMETVRVASEENPKSCVLLLLRLPRKMTIDGVSQRIRQLESIVALETI